MKSRIMYIESKGGGLTDPARIGRVAFSKTGATLYYRGGAFQSLKGVGFKSNYFDVETGGHYLGRVRRDNSCTQHSALLSYGQAHHGTRRYARKLPLWGSAFHGQAALKVGRPLPLHPLPAGAWRAVCDLGGV